MNLGLRPNMVGVRNDARIDNHTARQKCRDLKAVGRKANGRCKIMLEAFYKRGPFSRPFLPRHGVRQSELEFQFDRSSTWRPQYVQHRWRFGRRVLEGHAQFGRFACGFVCDFAVNCRHWALSVGH